MKLIIMAILLLIPIGFSDWMYNPHTGMLDYYDKITNETVIGYANSSYIEKNNATIAGLVNNASYLLTYNSTDWECGIRGV